jgi:hypothetical protein
MGKVGVARTVARAYSFPAIHILGLLGTSWLPALFFAGLLSWWLVTLGAEAHTLANGSLAIALGQTLLFLAGSALLLSSVAVPLTRMALGEVPETAIAHFVIGKRELRLFFGFLRLLGLVLAALMIFAGAFTFAVQGGLVHLIANALPGPKDFSTSAGEMWRGIPLRKAVADAGLVTFLVVIAFVTLRFGFFLAPLAAADERTRLSRAAHLSGRNFWRVAVSATAIGLPSIFAVAALCYVVLGPSARAGIAQAYSVAAMDDLLEILGAHAVPLAIVISACAVVFLGLVAGGSANAYRDRIEGGDEETERRPATDQRDSGTPFQDAGLVPAFAAVHPLATLLPAETAHAETPIAAPATQSHELVSEVSAESADSAPQQEAAASIDGMVDVVPELSAPVEHAGEAPAVLAQDEGQMVAVPVEPMPEAQLVQHEAEALPAEYPGQAAEAAMAQEHELEPVEG